MDPTGLKPPGHRGKATNLLHRTQHLIEQTRNKPYIPYVSRLKGPTGGIFNYKTDLKPIIILALVLKGTLEFV